MTVGNLDLILNQQNRQFTIQEHTLPKIRQEMSLQDNSANLACLLVEAGIH